MKISILGLGYFGEPLARLLKSQGHEVWGSTTKEEKKTALENSGLNVIQWSYPETLPYDFKQSDLIILNIPPFEHQPKWFESWNLSKNVPLIFISSTSVYQEAPLVQEDSPLEGQTAFAKILIQEEKWAQTFKHHMILRFGGLIGRGRHPGKSLSGKTELKGKLSPVNLIHVDDAVGFTAQAIKEHKFGEIFNVVSDEHHSRKEFYQEFCGREKLPLPTFDEADLAVGKTIANQKLKSFYDLKWPTMLGKDL